MKNWFKFYSGILKSSMLEAISSVELFTLKGFQGFYYISIVW